MMKAVKKKISLLPSASAEGRELRRKKRRREAVTVRPLPVVTSRGCGGFKRRQLLLLLLHPLSGRTEDTCEAAGPSSLKTRETK